MSRILIRNVKPIALPSSLDALRGPQMGGTLFLNHAIIWAPGAQTIHLDSPGKVDLGYTALINEGTREDLERWLNKDLLIDFWPRANLPWDTYDLWEAAFPELPPNQYSDVRS